MMGAVMLLAAAAVAAFPMAWAGGTSTNSTNISNLNSSKGAECKAGNNATQPGSDSWHVSSQAANSRRH